MHLATVDVYVKTDSGVVRIPQGAPLPADSDQADIARLEAFGAVHVIADSEDVPSMEWRRDELLAHAISLGLDVSGSKAEILAAIQQA